MLATKSVLLKGTESFEEAYDLMPDKDINVRYLKTPDGEEAGFYQFYDETSQKWSSPKKAEVSESGGIIDKMKSANSKSKLKSAKIFYDIFDKPTHVGTDICSRGCDSWLIGDISNCNIFGDDYTVQGILLSNAFDPTPRFYISFKRLVCENQFGTLGSSNSSMYIDMNAFLSQAYNLKAKEKLQSMITNEVYKRESEQTEVYKRLYDIKVTEPKMQSMFEKLTVDRVAKNSRLRQDEEKRLANYISAYNMDDNQNYKGTLFGFVNAHTRISTREKTNPLDVVKPIITSNLLDSPCDFTFLCKEAVINASKR